MRSPGTPPTRLRKRLLERPRRAVWLAGRTSPRGQQGAGVHSAPGVPLRLGMNGESRAWFNQDQRAAQTAACVLRDGSLRNAPRRGARTWSPGSIRESLRPAQATDTQCHGWTGPCGSWYRRKTPSAITIRKLSGENDSLLAGPGNYMAHGRPHSEVPWRRGREKSRERRRG